MNTSKTKRGRVGSTALFAPFADWSKGAEYYFGYTVDADGNNVTDPDEDQPDLTEWHLEYVGGEIYELEYCPAENCSTTVYRGNIPTRDFFVALMSNVENAPKIDWANVSDQTPRTQDVANTTDSPERLSASVLFGHWCPVDVSKPETFESVIVWGVLEGERQPDSHEGQWNGRLWKSVRDDEMADIDSLRKLNIAATHWMPRPRGPNAKNQAREPSGLNATKTP